MDDLEKKNISALYNFIKINIEANSDLKNVLKDEEFIFENVNFSNLDEMRNTYNLLLNLGFSFAGGREFNKIKSELSEIGIKIINVPHSMAFLSKEVATPLGNIQYSPEVSLEITSSASGFADYGYNSNEALPYLYHLLTLPNNSGLHESFNQFSEQEKYVVTILGDDISVKNKVRVGLENGNGKFRFQSSPEDPNFIKEIMGAPSEAHAISVAQHYIGELISLGYSEEFISENIKINFVEYDPKKSIYLEEEIISESDIVVRSYSEKLVKPKNKEKAYEIYKDMILDRGSISDSEELKGIVYNLERKIDEFKFLDQIDDYSRKVAWFNSVPNSVQDLSFEFISAIEGPVFVDCKYEGVNSSFFPDIDFYDNHIFGRNIDLKVKYGDEKRSVNTPYNSDSNELENGYNVGSSYATPIAAANFFKLLDTIYSDSSLLEETKNKINSPPESEKEISFTGPVRAK